MLRVLLILALAFSFACSTSSTPSDDDPPVDSGTAIDSGTVPDLGSSCDDECLCEGTAGTWDEGSCGHYSCGMPPTCEAIIPGCDCGTGRNFVAGTGCVDDATCGCSDEQCLCEGTGGTWDDGACGHYVCGVPNDCRALIPGCDCGSGQTFADGVGCADDPGC